jgi:hypothetical protein
MAFLIIPASQIDNLTMVQVGITVEIFTLLLPGMPKSPNLGHFWTFLFYFVTPEGIPNKKIDYKI